MKRLYKIIAVVLVFCTLFAGCSSASMPENTTDTPTTLSTQPATTQTTAPTTEPTEATIPTEATLPTAEPSVPPTEEPTVPPTAEVTVPPTEEPTVPPTVETTAPTEPVHIHSYSDATCSQPKTCACGATEGAPLDHKYVDGACTLCRSSDPHYIASVMVWIPTKGGKKYHTNPSCSNMIDPECVTKEEAENLGFGPCKRCH